MRSPDDAANYDPSELITGHNGETQRVDVKSTRYVRDPATGRQMMERVCVDQFGNWYLMYSAQMIDGELYDVVDWVRPNVFEKFRCVEGELNDSLIDEFRRKAFWVFCNTSTNIQVADAISQGVRRMSANLAGGHNAR